MAEIEKRPVKIVETVLRDAHQSLLATRMSTEQMLPIIDKMDKVGYHAVECWGGATFDSCLRFLKEDPWDRLRKLRDGFKNTKLQMLFRGQNILGYNHYADDVVEYFVQKSIANGIDIIRIFDCLNDIRNLETAVKATNKEKGHAQIALCYTLGDAYTLDYWKDIAKRIEDMGADSLTNRGKDVKADTIKYCWHYSQATVADQNSWQVAGEAYIKENFPNWENVAPDNYYSEQDAEKAVSIGASILEAHSDIDLIICNDSTALPGQCKAAQNKGLTKDDVTITGFASPMSIKDYCAAGVIEQWGLWDCGVQGAMGCYLAAYLAAGNEVHVGDKIDIPSIGEVEVMPNDCLVEGASTAEVNNGVVLLPERTVFNADNMNDYNF